MIPKLKTFKVAMSKKAIQAMKEKQKQDTYFMIRMTANMDDSIDYLYDMEQLAKSSKNALEQYKMKEVQERLEDVLDYCELVKLSMLAARKDLTEATS